MKCSVSVVIPIYNASQYLGRLFDLILGQTLSSFELILVDDGSTDNSLDLVQSMAKRDSRVKYYVRNRDPKGSVTCRNIGFSLAIGKYIIHLDVDDLFQPTLLEQRVAFMEQHPECDYATFFGCSVRKGKNDRYEFSGKVWGVQRGSNDLACFLATDYPYSVWNNIYVRERFLNETWDEHVKIYTDFSYIVPIIQNGYSHLYANNKEPDYFYCIDASNSMCKQYISEEKFESTLYLFKKTIESMPNTMTGRKNIRDFYHFIELQYYRVMDTDDLKKAELYLKFIGNYYSKNRISVTKIRYSITRNLKTRFAGKHADVICNMILDPFWICKFVKNKRLGKSLRSIDIGVHT